MILLICTNTRKIMKGQLFDIGVNGANEYFFVAESDNISYLRTKRFEGLLGFTSDNIYTYQMKQVKPSLPADVMLGMKIALSIDLLSFHIHDGWTIPLQTMGIYEEISNFADSSCREIQIVNQIIADYLVKVQETAKELFVKTIPQEKVLNDEFLRAYIETALWSSTYEKNGQDCCPFDRDSGIEDLHPLTLFQMMEDCQTFQRFAWSEIKDNQSQAGHDFWLTRNRHGAGFWDGDWKDEVGKKLTALSHFFGETSLEIYEGKVC